MGSHRHLRRLGMIIAAACLVGTLYACGQKGDLYLPDSAPAEEKEDSR